MKRKKINDFIGMILPCAVVVGYLGMCVDLVKYPGFVEKHIYVNPTVLFDIVILMSVVTIFIRNKETYWWKKGFGKSVFLLNETVLVSAVIIYIVTMTMEGTHYPNYIFSKYHINVYSIPTLVLSSVFIELLRIFGDFKVMILSLIKHHYKNASSKYIFFLIVIILSFYAVKNLMITFPMVSNNNSFLLSHIKIGYKEKMKESWGVFFSYMMFVKQYTGDSSKIAIPPAQIPWDREGSGAMDRYFLYPRVLISGKIDSLPEGEYDYIMIAKGSLYATDLNSGWPKIPVKANELIYFDPDTGKVTVLHEDYDPNKIVPHNSWGLIKIH